MRFSLSWLREHLDDAPDLDALASALNRLGLEVEAVEDRGAALAPFRIARVLEAAPHPNADRLRACRVEAGDGVVRSVVCGAPNARSGMIGVLALPGATIPGTGVVLKAGEIRGVRSEAMLLSAREMGLGDDHSGIVELPEDAPVGAPYAAWAGLDDPVIELSITPDRGDALSVRGVARDLAAAGLGTLRPWSAAPVAPAYPSPIRWAIGDPRACPWVLGRAIRGVRNGPSPEWLRRRLLSAGLRPISALVDVTNLMTLDLGRPLHVFDAGEVEGGTLTMRLGRPGDAFDALNGRRIEPGPEDAVIADARGADSLAGLVGGERTGCGEGTTEVFLECALFDPVRVALTGRRHELRSDARARFERGVDPAFLPEALEAATRLIQAICGGEASEVVSAGTEPAWRREATLRFERLSGLGGAEVAPERAVASLEALGFAPTRRDGASVTVSVPSWRNDVAGAASAYRVSAPALEPAPGLDPGLAAAAAEGVEAVEAECDLVEEVLRLPGLDAIPPVSLPRAEALPAPALTPAQSRAGHARRVLAARGMLEAVTFSFVSEAEAELFGGAPAALRLENPIASDLDRMRPTPLAALAPAAARNAARGHGEIALFEVGPAYADASPDGQTLMAAGLRHGRTPRHPLSPSRPLDALDAKGDALAVLLALGVPPAALSTTPDAPGHYHPGRSGTLRSGPKLVLARFGELHPAVLSALGLPGPAAAFELFLDALTEPKRRRRGAPELPAFQPVRRDLAFLLGPGASAEAALRAARGAEKALVAAVSVFDRYEGPPLAPGEVSLGLEVTLQPRELSLTEAEIEAAVSRVAEAVARATGGRLRG